MYFIPLACDRCIFETNVITGAIGYASVTHVQKRLLSADCDVVHLIFRSIIALYKRSLWIRK